MSKRVLFQKINTKICSKNMSMVQISQTKADKGKNKGG